MKSNAMAGAVSLVGMGLCGIAAAMLLQVTGTRADASPRAADAFGPGEPTVVWFGVTRDPNYASRVTYHRLWSDGRLEVRGIEHWVNPEVCNWVINANCDWREVPPPPGGDGFACRADTNGDRRVDGADLAAVLGTWGDSVSCDPQPTYPCFDLAGLQLPQ